MKRVCHHSKPTCIGPFTRLTCGSAFTLIEALGGNCYNRNSCAMLFPTLNRAKSSAQSAKCKSNLRQWGLALDMYVSSNNQCYPFGLVMTSQTPYSSTIWAEYLDEYSIKWTERGYHCSGYKGFIGSTNWPTSTGGFTHGWLSSYGYNIAGTSYNSGQNLYLGLGWGAFRRPVRASAIMAPSQMIAIGDSRLNYSPGDGRGRKAQVYGFYSVGISPATFLTPRGMARVTMWSFCDYHAKPCNLRNCLTQRTVLHCGTQTTNLIPKAGDQRQQIITKLSSAFSGRDAWLCYHSRGWSSAARLLASGSWLRFGGVRSAPFARQCVRRVLGTA